MFTEGLDNSALKWVQEGSVRNNNGNKGVPFSVLNERTRIDPILSNVNGSSTSRNFGLPPPGKFLSGHLSTSAIPVIHGDESGSGSDNDISSESEEDAVYGGRYSLDSSPQDDRVPSPRRAGLNNYRYSNTARPLPPSRMSYSSDYMSSDVYSSVELSRGRRRGGGVRGVSDPVGLGLGRGLGYAEDEDSGSGSEYSSNQVTSNVNGGATHSATYSQATVSEDCGTSATSRMNVPKEDETPSAPPACSTGYKASQTTIGAQKEISVDSCASLNKPEPNAPTSVLPGVNQLESTGTRVSDFPSRGIHGGDSAGSSGSHAARLPTFHASQGPWHSVLAYDACVRLCLNAWARSCMEAPIFLENECALLRNAFGLQQILLQSEEEILAKRGSEVAADGAPQKPKKIIGKMKVQVRKVRMGLVDAPTGCSFSSLKTPAINMESARLQLSKIGRSVVSGWHALRRVRFVLHKPTDGSLSRKGLAYVHASTQYMKQVSGLLKVGVTTTLRNNSSSYEAVQETHSCVLRLKSTPEEDAVRMQPGSGETHVFFPDGLGDDLIIEVLDSKGKMCGRVLAQVATIADDPNDKLRWWSIFREPEHELVGKIQLYINFSTSADESSHPKCGSVAETVAYDLVLEVAMKVQHFQQRHLLLHGEWKWLLEEFATYYGVSDAYTKLRYLSYVMDVATPTADCLSLVYDLLYPVVMKGHSKKTLSHQENRILGEVEDQVEQILALVFENYKSLDESLSSGITDVFRPATGKAAPALEPAVKLYSLLHDILSPESQTKLCRHFQAAAKKRSKRHLCETDEYVSNNGEGCLADHVTVTTAYQKMKTLCFNISNEVSTDIEIHNHHILPSFVDLPNLSASIYSVELCNRIREFLIACPPPGPSPPVAELVIATADFQRDLVSWNINPIKGGVDAKELFHLYIVVWIQDKRLALLERCKLDKVKWSGVRTQHSTTPFIDEMYDRLKETLNEYEVIICRWPEYSFALENAVADIEKAIIETLDRQYSDVLAPLKESLAPKKFGFKYVQKLTKRSPPPYVVPDELGIVLNSMKRMLDVLRPKMETQFKSWGSCIPAGCGGQIPGERLSEVTVMLRAKFRNFLQALVEKLVENTRLHGATKIKKILQDSKENVGESDVRNRMQPLKEQLATTMNHLHSLFETHVFIAVCRGYWDRIGQDVLSFLENRKENKSWYKGSRIAVSVLDDTFASQMQQLLGNALQDKDIEPPRSVMEVRSMLCKDGQNPKNNFYY